MTRRWIALALLVALVVTIAPQSSRAQVPMIAHGIINATVASVNVANTTAEQLLYSYPIPGALLATWTTNNQAFGAGPLHLRLHGTLETNNTTGTGDSVGPVTLSVNLGGSSGTATMTVLNGRALGANLGGQGSPSGAMKFPTPWNLDVSISPIATRTTQNCTDLRPCAVSLFMSGRFSYASNTQNTGGVGLATEVVYNAATLAVVNVNVAGPTPLNVQFRWASAASQNSLNMYNGVLKLGF